jgi:hypothetical protein
MGQKRLLQTWQISKPKIIRFIIHIKAQISRICELLGGKGAGQGNRFQAKVTNLSNHKLAEKCIKEYFD